MTTPRVLPVGATAVLMEVDDAARATALADQVRRQVRCLDVVPAARTVLVDGLDASGRAALDRLLAAHVDDAPASTPDAPVVEIPTVYDGADLADVAARWGTDPDGVVSRHTSLEFTASFTGFAPGFTYLAGLPDELALPRLDTPRPRVPAGSVALADTWCGVYPTASPGGWRLIGRTDAVLWEPDRPAPALLPPGTRVRFVAR